MDYKITPKQKIWNTPEIYLLDTTAVNGGSGATFKEGARVNAGSLQVLTNGGALHSTNTTGAWDNYHS